MRPSSSPDTEHEEIRDPAATDARTPVDDGPYFYRHDESTSGRRRVLWLIAAALAIAALAAGYYYWLQRQEVTPQRETLPPRAETIPTPPPPAEPAIRHPIEAAKPETDAALVPETAAPLPALETSDQSVADALAAIGDRGALGEFLNTTGFIRRVVVTIDNLPRRKAPQRLWPVQPTPGKFLTSGDGEAVYLSADNARRYDPFLRWMESADTGKCVALYVRFYPLFQQAYKDLGYPNRHFNDRLVEVIDHLLVTPEIDGPIRLAKPWIMYEFADPALEARSAGQKTLIRMGAANQLRVKAKLREFRRQIAGRTPTQ